MSETKLLFDIGGTNTRVGVSFDGTTLASFEKFPTSQDFWEGIDHIAEVAKKMAKDISFTSAWGGVAGPLDKGKTKTVNPPNLPGWRQHPLKEELQSALNCPVYLENDTALAGLGEAVEGVGKNYSIVAYITISTGINGVRIVDKKIAKSALGFEIGHQIIDMDNSVLQGSSGRGELEDFVSGREIAKRYGRHPYDISDRDVWKVLTKYLSVGVVNTVVYWSPEVIILGGAIADRIIVEDLKNEVAALLPIFSSTPDIVKGELEDRGVLLGALHISNI